jgi:hypothetical protein
MIMVMSLGSPEKEDTDQGSTVAPWGQMPTRQASGFRVPSCWPDA